MGGNAFANLWTPRIPAAIYEIIKADLHCQLGRIFELVDSPIDGPEKTDFGDIDIIVAKPLDSSISTDDLWKMLTDVIGAVEVIRYPVQNANIAIPWPDHFEAPIDPSSQAPGALGNPSDDETFGYVADSARHAYIQVDISIHPSKQSFSWSLFRHGHGDFWNILGFAIRHSGIVLGETGLYFRIKETEHLGRVKSRLLICTDPVHAVAFLGLKTEPSFWHRPFESFQALFDFIATCPFFYIPSADDELSLLVKSADHKRAKRRACFSQWMEEFVPKYRAKDVYTQLRVAPEQVLELAVEMFGEDIRTLYISIRDGLLDNAVMHDFRRDIKPRCKSFEGANVSDAGIAASTFKRILLDDHHEIVPPGITVPQNLMGPPRFWDQELLWEWVGSSWKQVLKHRQAINASVSSG